MNEALGRAAVRLAARYLRRRYRREIRIGLVAAVLVAAGAAWLATRDVQEG